MERPWIGFDFGYCDMMSQMGLHFVLVVIFIIISTLQTITSVGKITLIF